MTDNLDKASDPKRARQQDARPRAGRKPNSTPRPDASAKATAGESQSSGSEREAEAQRTREALYDRFAERSRELFESSQEKGRDAFEKAMRLARDQLAAAGEFTAEQGEVFEKYLKRDLEQTADDMRTLGQEAAERLHPWRLGAGALSSMARLLRATGNAMGSLSRRAEDALSYQTGELTTAGTLTCGACGRKVRLKATGHVPPCPNCRGTRFRKSY